MSTPFEYKDLMEENIKSLEAHNNKCGSTGKLNELRIPSKHRQQAALRPKFYRTGKHSASPLLILSQSPYVTNKNNPTGNPENKPVTFALKDTALTEIEDTDILPWLVRHREYSSLNAIDDGNNGPARPFEHNSPEKEPAVTAKNGFVSLAVGESRAIKVNFGNWRWFDIEHRGEVLSGFSRKLGTLGEMGNPGGAKRREEAGFKNAIEDHCSQ